MEIWAYLDDSGHEKQNTLSQLFLGVGGATATLDVWGNVISRWRRALEKAGFDEFHVKDFGKFRKTDQEKANSLIDELTKIVDDFLRPVVAWGNERPFNTPLTPHANGPHQRRAHDFAVEWCFKCLISRVESDDIVHIVVSKTPKYVGRVKKIHSALKEKHIFGNRLGDITFHTPKDDIPLQVADLVISGFIKGMKHNNFSGEWYDVFLEKLWAKSNHQGDLRYFPFTELVKWKSILDET